MVMDFTKLFSKTNVVASVSLRTGAHTGVAIRFRLVQPFDRAAPDCVIRRLKRKVLKKISRKNSTFEIEANKLNKFFKEKM